jgi:hypothetical protein
MTDPQIYDPQPVYMFDPESNAVYYFDQTQEFQPMYYEEPNYLFQILGCCFAYFMCTVLFPFNIICGVCTFKYMNMDEANNFYFKLFIRLLIMITSILTILTLIGGMAYGIYYACS